MASRKDLASTSGSQAASAAGVTATGKQTKTAAGSAAPGKKRPGLDPFRKPSNPYASHRDRGDGKTLFPEYLPWDADGEVKSHHDEVLANREAELKNYCAKHPELTSMVNDFLLQVLQNKPHDVLDFAKVFFTGQSTDPPTLKKDLEEQRKKQEAGGKP